MTTHFDWNTLYLTCFGLGLVLCVLSFLTGTMHLHFGHFRMGHGNANAHHLSPLNAFTLTGFLVWFGGAGYLLNRSGMLVTSVVLFLAAVSGIAGAALLLWFLGGVLMKQEKTLEPADTEIVGMLGRISAAVKPGGFGEMLYTQNGARRSAIVRAEDNSMIPRGTEVVVMSYAKGVARVRKWSEFEDGLMGGQESSSVAGDEV